MPRRASIRALLLRLVLAAALPLAALAAWLLYSSVEQDSRQARRQVLYLAQLTASDTARFLGEAQNILNGLAARPAVRALDASRCDPVLKDFLGLAPRFANVVTMTIDGAVVCSAAAWWRRSFRPGRAAGTGRPCLTRPKRSAGASGSRAGSTSAN